MNTISIKDFQGQSINLNLGAITQLLGLNGEKKEFIISSIVKHYSKYKYEMNEEFLINNVRINNIESGRNYFFTHYAGNMIDIEKELKNSKNTLINEYLIKLIDDFDLSKKVDQFNEYIESIVVAINDSIRTDILNININPTYYGIEELIKSNLDVSVTDNNLDEFPEHIPNYKKIIFYIELIERLNQAVPKKRLIVLHNFDRYLTNIEFRQIFEKASKLCELNDFTFLITSSLEGYAYLDETFVNAINVVNEIIFNFPSIELLTKYIQSHYPYYKKIEHEELLQTLKPIIHKVGSSVDLLNIDSQVVLKLLNLSERIENSGIKIPNDIELDYIQKK